MPTLIGKGDVRNYSSTKLALEDGAVINLDWVKGGSKHLLVLLPGLEGHSRRIYTSRLAQAVHGEAWDVLLPNYRGSNKSINPVAKTYHGGAIDDLHEILGQVIESNPQYESISLGGFSLGGNIVLNYLGNPRLNKSELIQSAICFSVPCDFSSSSPLLTGGLNHWIYGKRFVSSLKQQVREQKEIFRGHFDEAQFDKIRTLRDFDEVFTSRVNGYNDSNDYYQQVSSLQFLNTISVPTLLVSAKNDPLLSESCYPRKIAENSELLYLETPAFGGHVGFANDLSFESFYYADRAVSWLAQIVA